MHTDSEERCLVTTSFLLTVGHAKGLEHRVDTKRYFFTGKRRLLDRIGEEAVFWLLFNTNECVIRGRNSVLLFVDR